MLLINYGMNRKSKQTLQKKLIGLFVIIVVEIFLGTFLWSNTKHQATSGYIVKNGNSYVLLWKNKDNTLEEKKYAFLHEALQFAQKDLGLQMGSNPNFTGNVEGVWEREDIGKHMVFWKTSDINILHRLTFRRATEAKYFADAFKRGAYSTSPLGHSIFLGLVQ
jgi:hypothetical protein